MGLWAVLLLTYPEWFFGTYEHRALYPLDETRTDPTAGMTEVIVTAPDGTELVTWQAAPRPGQPTLLYLPGNAGNLAARHVRFTEMMAEGFGIIALSWRGSGGSGGRASEEVLPADALMLFDSVCVQRCVIYGESLGAAVAIKIAAVREVPAVALQSPFTSIDDLAKLQFPHDDLSPYITQHWHSLETVPAVTEPLLVFHGTDDKLVPIAQGQAIVAAAGSADKTLLTFEARGHQSMWGPDLTAPLYAFFRAHGAD